MHKEVNIKFVWDFDLKSIPVSLQHNAGSHPEE